MRDIKTLLVLAIIVLFASVDISAQVADWPQWRGPNRDGISKETGLLKQWPAAGPTLVWKAAGAGTGYSSLAISNGRLFTMGLRRDREYVMAFDVATGKEVWATPHGGAYRDSRGDGPRGTPTVDGSNLYAFGGNGDLSSIDAKTGRIVWTMNVLQKFGGENINWGMSESPLVIGEKLLINAGGPGASIVALNKKDGSLIWKSQSDKAGYSSGMPVQIGNTTQVVFSPTSGPWASTSRTENFSGNILALLMTLQTLRRRSSEAIAYLSLPTTARAPGWWRLKRMEKRRKFILRKTCVITTAVPS